MEDTEYITLEEAADLLGEVSVRVVRRRIDEEGWDSYLDTEMGEESVRKVRKSDVIEYMTDDLPSALLREISGESSLTDPRMLQSHSTDAVDLSEDFAQTLDDVRNTCNTLQDAARLSDNDEIRRIINSLDEAVELPQDQVDAIVKQLARSANKVDDAVKLPEEQVDAIRRLAAAMEKQTKRQKQQFWFTLGIGVATLLLLALLAWRLMSIASLAL
ncbi:MAG: hypothetical protein ACOCR1_00200 [Planctomycetota bacterium]